MTKEAACIVPSRHAAFADPIQPDQRHRTSSFTDRFLVVSLQQAQGAEL